MLKHTPLWFYILREAELNNGKLEGRRRPHRGRDLPPRDGGEQFSIVRDPAFTPTLGPNNTTFRMVDLLLFAFEGMKAKLAPLGD